MGFTILITRTVRKRLWIMAVTYFSLINTVFPQSRINDTTITLEKVNYISAFNVPVLPGNTGKLSVEVARDTSGQKWYTIQICTMDFPVKDTFFQGNYSVCHVQMGHLYRYIFCKYFTLEEARQKLITVQKLFPGACIREYHKGILGKVADMNIQQIRIKN